MTIRVGPGTARRVVPGLLVEQLVAVVVGLPGRTGIVGQDQAARRRIADALGEDLAAPVVGVDDRADEAGDQA